ncbi:branched-chain amino acid ABC transporter ATP-binding protein [Candidatus Bathyarchaeota archaeon]|nr:MAG: branched-chain amino acid ABC transporter ATP-binding protein [Candidatus Bathyarchaeota archaeon]
MLKIDSLNVKYGAIQVLYNVSLNVGKEEIVALLGSNGAGKTTLLNTICGLIKPSSGSISFLGKNIENLPPHKILRSGILQVPEGRRIFPYMTVLENLLVGANNPEAWRRRNELLERVFNLFPILKERRNMQARLLSGGEQQMLAIGRSLMGNPRLLLIDEPSLGLAPKVLTKIYDTIKSLRDDEDVTILLAEQNAQYALNIADRGYILENGRIVLEGLSMELLNNEHVKKAYLGV